MGGSNGRALDATQQLFFMGWCASVIAWGPYVRAALRRFRPATRRALSLAAALAFIACVALTGHAREVLRGGWREAAAWNRGMDLQRAEARAASAAGVSDAVVTRLGVPCPAFFFGDGITSDPRDWQNQSYALYFSLKSIRTGAARH